MFIAEVKYCVVFSFSFFSLSEKSLNHQCVFNYVIQKSDAVNVSNRVFDLHFGQNNAGR